ncbi:MAG TPA: tryptophan synthase subunit alpha [Segetibacter sp.]
MNSTVEIIEFEPALAVAFKELNLAWICKYFAVETIDEEVLSKPQQHIIDKEGKIFFAKVANEIVGTFALMKIAEDKYELSKMAVSEDAQGKQVGNKMLEYCLQTAKELKAKKVILFSNTILKPAIHLYKKYGFKEVPLESSEYKRSNIKMEIELTTMTRIEELFKRKQHNILNVYCTAGFPKLESTLEVIQALQNNGADLIELGMPYSDPLADGPVIQQSGAIALENGMTISKLFEQLKGMRSVTKVPIILMGYMNPVLQYGFENFCAEAAEVGVDGLILPDLPIYEYETEYSDILKKYNLNLIFLVTPETKEDRIRRIDELSSGFLYAVSSSSTTGSNKEITDQTSYFQRLKSMKLKNPILVGFGIKDKQTFDAACKYTNGAIIGSAYIKALSKSGDINATTAAFIKPIIGLEQ